MEDITDDVKAAIEADKPPAIKETEEEYMERLKKENFAKWAIIESKRRRKEAAEKKEQEKEKE